jgi:hypothetical protein
VDEGFTKRDFKGDYAFHLDGVLTSPGMPVVTAYDAAVGRLPLTVPVILHKAHDL